MWWCVPLWHQAKGGYSYRRKVSNFPDGIANAKETKTKSRGGERRKAAKEDKSQCIFCLSPLTHLSPTFLMHLGIPKKVSLRSSKDDQQWTRSFPDQHPSSGKDDHGKREIPPAKV